MEKINNSFSFGKSLAISLAVSCDSSSSHNNMLPSYYLLIWLDEIKKLYDVDDDLQYQYAVVSDYCLVVVQTRIATNNIGR